MVGIFSDVKAAFNTARRAQMKAAGKERQDKDALVNDVLVKEEAEAASLAAEAASASPLFCGVADSAGSGAGSAAGAAERRVHGARRRLVMFELVRGVNEARREMQAAPELPRLQGLEQARQPWELADDDSKYMWRLDDTNNLNAWCEPRNANGIKVNGGPVPPLGSV